MNDIAKLGALCGAALIVFVLTVDYLKEGKTPQAQPTETAQIVVQS